MKSLFSKTLLFSSALLLAANVSSSFATTIYTSQSSFLAATAPGYYLETFNSLPQNSFLSSPQNFSGNGFSYSASAAAGFFNVGPSGDTWLSTNNQLTDIVFTLTSNNITSVGGYFFLTDSSGALTGGTVTVTLNDGSTFSIANPNSTSFVGFTSAIPILSLTVHPQGNAGAIVQGEGGAFTFATVNDFIVGGPQGSAVPENGSSALLMGVALAGLFGVRRFLVRHAA
jgi:hypothetical protein